MTPSKHFSPCQYNKNWNRKCRWQVFKRNKRKKVSVESHWQLQSCELERRTIRINGCIWPSAIFLSRQRMDLSIFWSALITLNSIIRTLISVEKMVDLSPDSDNLGSCIGAPDENETAKTRSHVIRSLFTREPIWSKGKESCCDCWSFVHRSRTRKTTTEEVVVPLYLLANSSRTFGDGLGTWYRHVLKRLRPFHQSPWSSKGSDKRQRHSGWMQWAS